MLTWLRLAFWMMAGMYTTSYYHSKFVFMWGILLIGFLIYGCYGLKHSSLESPELSSYPDEDLCPLVEHESFEEHLN